NRGNEPNYLLKTQHLAAFEAKNELVFECKRTQFEPKNGAKKPLLTRNRSQDSRVGGGVAVCRSGGFTPPCGEVNSPLHHQTETLPSRKVWRAGKHKGLHGLRIRPLHVLGSPP